MAGAADGSFSTQMIVKANPKDWDEMHHNMRTALLALEDDVKNGNRRTYSDRPVLNNLVAYYKADQVLEMKKYFYENFDKLNASDYKDWLNKVHIGKPSSLWTHQQYLEMSTINMKDEQRANIHNGVTRWYINYQEINKVEPDDAKVTDMITSALKQFSTGGWFGKKAPYDMTPGERVDAYTAAETDPQREDLLKYFNQAEKRQIAYDYFKQLDSDVFNDTLIEFKADGFKLDMSNHTRFKNRFEIILKKRNKARLDQQSKVKIGTGRFYGARFSPMGSANAADIPERN